MPEVPTIVHATIGPMPRPMPVGMFDPLPTVTVWFSDGTEKTLFTFYPDEIQFSESELLGLTEAQARHLKLHKDQHWLQKP
jgi:hypothetical protein